ncbi:adenosine receptor A2b-like [Stylophora pistillata]|uniref:adenosine receptor A2b-like n=1 Tax=Stylophora pistillata TaxID=50429 RepID=UPI000C03D8A9|nr:adenosine receptor A2b-like [Stylophora pistillata]XP_022794695.1 adenosine receptor A2b-like [Stylophora pistillata]
MAVNSTSCEKQTSGQDIFCAIRLYGLQQKIFIVILIIIISITAVVGNVLIIVALKRVFSLHPPSKILFRCLASTDLGVGLLAGPLFVSFLTSQGHTGACVSLKTIFYCTAALMGVVSMLTLTTISADRLLALSLRLRYRQEVTTRRVRAIMVFFWLFSSVIATTLIYSSLLTRMSIFITELLCVAVSTFCFVKIYVKLRQHQMQIHVQKQVHQDQAFNIARYKKIVSGLVWVQITLIGCYVPHAAIQTIYVFRKTTSPSLDLMWDVTIAMVFLNSAANPCLYCWKVSEVRQAVKETIRGFFC